MVYQRSLSLSPVFFSFFFLFMSKVCLRKVINNLPLSFGSTSDAHDNKRPISYSGDSISFPCSLFSLSSSFSFYLTLQFLSHIGIMHEAVEVAWEEESSSTLSIPSPSWIPFHPLIFSCILGSTMFDGWKNLRGPWIYVTAEKNLITLGAFRDSYDVFYLPFLWNGMMKRW